MKSLDEIKEEVAIDAGYNDWDEFINDQPNHNVESIMDEVAKRYATEAIKSDRERTAHAATEKYKETGMTNTAANVKQIILNLPIELP